MADTESGGGDQEEKLGNQQCDKNTLIKPRTPPPITSIPASVTESIPSPSYDSARHKLSAIKTTVIAPALISTVFTLHSGIRSHYVIPQRNVSSSISREILTMPPHMIGIEHCNQTRIIKAVDMREKPKIDVNGNPSRVDPSSLYKRSDCEKNSLFSSMPSAFTPISPLSFSRDAHSKPTVKDQNIQVDIDDRKRKFSANQKTDLNMPFSQYSASCAICQCQYGNPSNRPKTIFSNPLSNISDVSHSFGSPITVPTVKTPDSSSYSQMKQSTPSKPLSARKNKTTLSINPRKELFQYPPTSVPFHHSPKQYKSSQSQNDSHTITTSNTAQYISKNISADLNQTNVLTENYNRTDSSTAQVNRQLQYAVSYVESKQIPDISKDSDFPELTGTQANQTILLANPEVLEITGNVNIPLKPIDQDGVQFIKSILQPALSKSQRDVTKKDYSSSKDIPRTISLIPITSMKTTQSANPEEAKTSSVSTTTTMPTAAVQLTMVNNQPQYVIRLFGQDIPLASLTVPTSEGLLELHSGRPEMSVAENTTNKEPVVSVSDTAVTITVSSVYSTATSNRSSPVTCMVSEIKERGKSANSPTPKPKYVCETCGKSYSRSWSYYSHLQEHGKPAKEYDCATCHKRFHNANALKQHLVSHMDDEQYPCNICNELFENPSALRVHQLSHADEKPFSCKVPGCSKHFSSSSALRIHQRVHQEEKPFVCKQANCGKAFKTQSELSRHEFRHTGQKPFKCDLCDKSFVRNDDLKRHHFTHTGQKRFKCDQCEFSCIQSFDLVKHKYIHGGEKPYKCDVCPKQFTRPARLREHQRLHTGERPFVCEECGKAFSQQASLKSHMLTHSGKKPFECDHCDKSFTTASDLRTHSHAHTGVKPFNCNICNKDFVSLKTLKRHGVVHSGEKPFRCDVCQKSFSRESDLKVHAIVHQDEKPFKCDQCSKSFTRFSTLKEHIRIHTGEFPYKCEICGKIFNHRSHLNVHVRTHTGEKPYKCTFCTKEFSRKISLRNHLRTHGIYEDKQVAHVVVEEVGVEEDDNLLRIAPIIDVSSSQVSSKRRREADGNQSELLQAKRQMTESTYIYQQQQQQQQESTLFSNVQQGERFQEVTPLNTSELNSFLGNEQSIILSAQIPSHTQMPQYLQHADGGGHYQLSLVDLPLQVSQNQAGGNISQMEGLETLQTIDSQTLQVMHEQVNIGGPLQLEQYHLSTPAEQQVVGMPVIQEETTPQTDQVLLARIHQADQHQH